MNISFHKHFEKRFAKLPLQVRKKAIERIKIFQNDPFARILDNHALVGKWTGYRSIDVTGDYRAIYLPVNDNFVKFYALDTHSNLYS
jgi:addiction module RelE/StbE family toxin